MARGPNGADATTRRSRAGTAHGAGRRRGVRPASAARCSSCCRSRRSACSPWRRRVRHAAAGEWGSAAFMGLFGLVFGLVGFGGIFAALKARRAGAETDAVRARHPEAPVAVAGGLGRRKDRGRQPLDDGRGLGVRGVLEPHQPAGRLLRGAPGAPGRIVRRVVRADLPGGRPRAPGLGDSGHDPVPPVRRLPARAGHRAGPGRPRRCAAPWWRPARWRCPRACA